MTAFVEAYVDALMFVIGLPLATAVLAAVLYVGLLAGVSRLRGRRSP